LAVDDSTMGVNQMEISVVLPVHNEKENLPTLCSDLIVVLRSLSKQFEIILINDGSTDGSDQILDALAQKDDHLRVIHMVGNTGQSNAMMAGFDYAAGRVIIAMDADNQNDPADIPRLLEKINQGYDVVSGWRKDRKDARFSKVIPSRIANHLISVTAGVPLHDYGCSLKAYRRAVIKGVKIYGETHRFLPILCSWRGARVGEIVVNHRPRCHGVSHYGYSRVAKVLLDLVLIRFLDKYLQHPIHFFGGFGLVSLAFAVGTFALMVYYKFWGGKPFIETPLPILSVLFILMGAMAVLLGIVAEVVMRTYFESQLKPPYRIARTVNLDTHTGLSNRSENG